MQLSVALVFNNRDLGVNRIKSVMNAAAPELRAGVKIMFFFYHKGHGTFGNYLHRKQQFVKEETFFIRFSWAG